MTFHDTVGFSPDTYRRKMDVPVVLSCYEGVDGEGGDRDQGLIKQVLLFFSSTP